MNEAKLSDFWTFRWDFNMTDFSTPRFLKEIRLIVEVEKHEEQRALSEHGIVDLREGN